MLTHLTNERLHYAGSRPRLPEGISSEGIACGDIMVEMQWFTRRPGTTVIVGIDRALTILKEATGYFEDDKFINTAHNLEVWAVQDGATVKYSGDIHNIQPVMRVATLPRLCHSRDLHAWHPRRSSRVATNVYER